MVTNPVNAVDIALTPKKEISRNGTDAAALVFGVGAAVGATAGLVVVSAGARVGASVVTGVLVKDELLAHVSASNTTPSRH